MVGALVSFEIESKYAMIQFSEERKHKLFQRSKLFLGTECIPCSFILGAMDNLMTVFWTFLLPEARGDCSDGCSLDPLSLRAEGMSCKCGKEFLPKRT